MQEPFFVDRRKPVNPIYRVGEVIPSTGIYRVSHEAHRTQHEVTLLLGDYFPPCSRCGSEVQFELVEAAPHIGLDRSFTIHLYELPHPADDDELKSA